MREQGGSMRALASAGGAGVLFALFWLVLGIPLTWSAGAGVAGYAALWALLSGMARERKPTPIGEFVDPALAKRAAAVAREAASSLEATAKGLGPRDALLPKLRELSGLLGAIAADVEEDPKDAAAAFAFVAAQGEASARAARLALQIESRGGSREQVEDARARVGAALDSLIAAHRRQLHSLQEDNLAELRAELETLEATLDLEADIDAARPGKRGDSAGGTTG
ncbi:MAG: hypothetical protein JXA15_00925 [Spirochaetales bacterium]|nr:hypothetical protein [Spirochaetales bacterium]